ncbi:hypothetical protein [Acaryochloris sp. CCMEE 5410]|uniref:hypothetical protein n=1 Tax=Acaryochloris sp. CCMEE 5410 TaxID=310037 RepID=UPI00024851CB|nr:hypothetical protein [Acaryochloris sp. CCMEE 5410]KAI9133681.1 hypothetical protein ON05_010485 [Acaryochloris sp. CCMEE 5410]
MRYRLGLLSTSVVGMLTLSSGSVLAQTTNNITVPNNSQSTANPEVSLDQQGSLVNTQVNSTTLGRSVVGNGIADCTSNGLSVSAYGSGVGPFDTGTVGGAITYTHSFGMDTCKQYAKNQLGKAKLETCFLLISNYSKMVKAGIDVSYTALMEVANVDCPPVTVRQAAIPQPSPSASNRPASTPVSLQGQQPAPTPTVREYGNSPQNPPQAQTPSPSEPQLKTALPNSASELPAVQGPQRLTAKELL